jgi:UDP-GlcNAc:undecaprenyl-phosphate GlcNAc-1-phosphate transferase
MYKILGIFIIALSISIFTIGSVIVISKLKRLFDEPSEDRKIHLFKIPNLGGVGIFISFIFTASLFIIPNNISYFNALISASLLIFSVGLKDDLIKVNPSKKLLAQVIAAFIMAYFGELRITSLYGLFGIGVLSYPVSLIISIFISVFIYNAINLIDGVDGLAGGLSLIASISLALFFLRIGSNSDALLSICLSGSIVGFLYYNITPAKTFMGDSGSLFTGLILSILLFRFCNLNDIEKNAFVSGPALALSSILIPIFDTVRVFILRIMNGKSPFRADSNHIHHRLLNMGFNHIQTSAILILSNIIIILLAYKFQPIGNSQLFIFLFIFVTLLNIFLWNISKSNKKAIEIKFFEGKKNNEKINDL